MKIIPNYQLSTFNFRVNNQQLQTNPNFGNIAKAVQLTTFPTIPKSPTREDFIAMVNKYVRNYLTLNYMLKEYDKKPQDGIKIFEKFSELINLIVDSEDDMGIRPFSVDIANKIYCYSKDFPEGLKTMLNMRKEDGDFRFLDSEDYIATEVFEKYPKKAQEYANAKDDIGNYRFSGEVIRDLIIAEMNDGVPAEKIQEFLNLTRPDGSYVFNSYSKDSMEAYISDPEAFTELCGIKRADKKYPYILRDNIRDAILSYVKYPNETKQVLQKMPRFSVYDLQDGNLVYMLYQAPKSFQTLARIKNNNGKFAYNKDNIYAIINKYDLGNKETANIDVKEILKMFNVLATLEYTDNYYNRRPLEFDQIMKAAEVYQKYPKETVEIIKDRGSKKTLYYQIMNIIPTVEEVEQYIRDNGV